MTFCRPMVLALRPEFSARQIARILGCSRNVVLGIDYRHRHPVRSTVRVQRIVEREDAILVLMCDGRRRTVTDVATALGISRYRAWYGLKRLERQELAQRVRGTSQEPDIWIETYEERL